MIQNLSVESFFQPQRSESWFLVHINRSTCIWQSWWDFATKSIYLCVQMLIYRHLTRTTLIRTFQRTKFIDVISLRYHTYAYSLPGVQCAYEGIDIFKIIFLTHGNWSHYTFLLEMKLITTHFATWQQKLSLVQPNPIQSNPTQSICWRNDFCKSFCIRNSHITRTTQVKALDVVVRMWGRGKVEEKPRQEFFKSFLHSYAITINYGERKM